MRVEIIQDDPHQLGGRIAFSDQPLHLVSKVVHRALRRHHQMPPARWRFTKQKEIAGAGACVFISVARHLARRRGHGRAGFLDQLLTRLLEVDFWARGLGGLGVEIEELFPWRDKFGTDRGAAPVLRLPGFAFIFFSSWRIVSCERVAAQPQATASSASQRRVPRSRPAGAGLQVTAIRWASALPVRRGGLRFGAVPSAPPGSLLQTVGASARRSPDSSLPPLQFLHRLALPQLSIKCGRASLVGLRPYHTG